MSVKEEYITIMDIAINKRYGTFAQYIKEEYQMSENEKLKMQERFLRPDINAEVNKIREALIEDTRQLIQIPSKKELTTIKANAPYGQSLRDILDKVLEMGAKDGFKTKDFDGYVGRIEWGETGEIVGIVCHLDVVPEQSEGWIDPPYSGVVKNGIIYGRGSNDNKGPTMAIYHALKLVRSLGYKPKKRLHLIFGCDEESGMTCMDHYLAQTDEIPSFGFVPDCTFPLNYGEHGIATIKLTGNIPHFIESLQAGNHPQIVAQDARLNVTQIPEDFEKNFAFFLRQQQLSGKIQHHAGFDISLHGKAAHGSRVSQGKNAAIAMLSLIGAAWKDETCTQLAYLLESWQGNGFDIAYKNMKTGELTLSVGTLVKTGNNLECVLDLRYPADLSYSEIITKMQQKLANVLPGFQLTTLEHRSGFYLDLHTKLIKELEEIYRRVSKDEKSVCKVSNGDTYARKFKNFVAFGPTTNEHLKNPLIGQAHQPNEGMEIATLLQGCEIYAEAIIQLLECSRSTK